MIVFVIVVALISAVTERVQAQTQPEDPPGLLGREAVLFAEPPPIETAALYTQTLKEAPANVTVITRQQIRRYGYRTLAEALSNVRGFSITYDGDLYFAGVRGFALPGDYNSRILVMINGHYLTDNVYGAMYMFGQDFGLDMDLVQRIEIVRGPSSSLYGSNGVFATINIFTTAPADAPAAYASTEIGSFGERKLHLSSSMYLGRGANLLLSGSGFYTSGRTIEVPELGGLRTGSVGAEHGYHTFAQLTWKDWSITANFQDRKGIVPIGWYGSDFGDTGTSSRDAHNFVEAVLTKPIGSAAELRWRLSYDQYRYFGTYLLSNDGIKYEDHDYALGDWIGTRLAYRRDNGRFGKLTIGAEANFDLRNLQVSETVQPEYNRYRETRQLGRSFGVFAQQVWNPTRKWTLFAGLRLDDARYHRPFLSPKLAAVRKVSETTSYKFMYGRAFRNPSTFEKFWEPNPMLVAERIHTVEVSREQRLANSIDVSASVFHYRLGGLIEGVPLAANNLQYQNVLTSHATGAEVEVSGQATTWLETSASYGCHWARFLNAGRDVVNSPTHVAQVRAAIPLVRNRLSAATAVRYVGERATPYGFNIQPLAIADLTLTTQRLHPDFDLQVGIRNLGNHQYGDMLSTEHLPHVLPRAGRSVFLKLIWHYRE